MNSEQREKYSRQILFAGIGDEGQQKLLASSAVLAGCGALGTVVANLLVRAGVGRLRIIDRDFVEPSNLQRQTLFEEADAREALPKAVAAERRLRAINSDARLEGIVADLTPKNSAELLGGFQLILDGTDNFQTRLLLNDAALSLDVPWIYAAAVGSYGVTMTIRPGETACLACLLEGDEKSAAIGGSHMRHRRCAECRRRRDRIAGSRGSHKNSCGQAGSSARPPGLDRRLERSLPIHPRRPPVKLPRLRAPRIHLSRRRSTAAHHHVRPRLRANPRTQPQARSARAGPPDRQSLRRQRAAQ